MDDRGFFAKVVSGELPEAPIAKLLGWRFLEFDASQQVIKVEMQAHPEFINPAGFVDGGMLAAMLDDTGMQHPTPQSIPPPRSCVRRTGSSNLDQGATCVPPNA
jgi:hypothetical protein